MSTYWERFAGDTQRFAIRIGLERDPDEGIGATPEESASWGSIEMWIEGRNVTAHSEAGTHGPSVRWYLLPILEWLSHVWDPLLHEERLPIANVADDGVQALQRTQFPTRAMSDEAAERHEVGWDAWYRRHSLIAARDGGLFPNVVFRRWRDRIELSWDSTHLAGFSRDIAFDVPAGTVRIAPTNLADEVHSLVSEATGAMVEGAPSSSRLARLGDQLIAVKSRSRSSVRAAWLAGLSANGMPPDERWDALVSRLDERNKDAVHDVLAFESTDLVVTRPPVLAELLASVAPELGQVDFDALTGFLTAAARGTPSSPLDELSRDVLPVRVGGAPFRQGYDLADSFRRALQLADDRPTDVTEIYKRLEIVTQKVTLSDRSVRALSIAGHGFGPSVAINSSYPWSGRLSADRFTLAHELCHVLFDRGIAGQSAIASGSWAPRTLEQRANAFAAMLLMPPEFVRSLVALGSSPVNTLDGVHALAERLGTGMRATVHHIANLGLIDEMDRDLLLEGLPPLPAR